MSGQHHDEEPGHGWGTATLQTHPNMDPDWPESFTDADEIRKCYGISAFENDYDFSIYPNCLIHEGPTEDRGTSRVGGTNWLAVGEKGSGKSTFGLSWAQRLMEVNDEAVVWRGSSSRSEWLPLRPWTRLFLPANAEADATWLPEDIRADQAGEPADLGDVVREVIHYEDPREINEQLQPGTFNVVYPDPSFAGCAEIMAESDRMTQPVEWVPKAAAEEPGDATPLIHWWFAYAIARLEYGPFDWTSLIFDEAADWMPQSARADQHETFEKIEAMRRVMADSRKFNFSLYFLAHHEENLHDKVRRTIEWRASMPDGTANPCKEHNDRPPVGFNQIPMRKDLLSRQPVGRLIFWNESGFNRVTWTDFPDWPEDEQRWLQISLSQNHTRARVESAGGQPQGVGDD